MCVHVCVVTGNINPVSINLMCTRMCVCTHILIHTWHMNSYINHICNAPISPAELMTRSIQSACVNIYIYSYTRYKCTHIHIKNVWMTATSSVEWKTRFLQSACVTYILMHTVRFIIHIPHMYALPQRHRGMKDTVNPICMCECICILHYTCTCAHITHVRKTTASLVELRTRSIHSACVNIHTYANTHDIYSYIHHTWHILILHHK